MLEFIFIRYYILPDNVRIPIEITFFCIFLVIIAYKAARGDYKKNKSTDIRQKNKDALEKKKEKAKKEQRRKNRNKK